MSDALPAIRLADVAVEADRITLLAPTTLEVAPGEVVAIMGPSGSGKTTVLSCVAGLRVPTSGTVQLGRCDNLGALSVAERSHLRRTHIGMVHQEPDLLPELNVQENVALRLIFGGVQRAVALRAAEQVLERLNMRPFAASSVASLSGGEAQRVAVARALLGSPSIILADEPTASLDQENSFQVTRILVSAAREGAAVLLATHDPAVATLCDRTFLLRSSA